MAVLKTNTLLDPHIYAITSLHAYMHNFAKESCEVDKPLELSLSDTFYMIFGFYFNQ